MTNKEDEIFPNPPDRIAEYRKYYASYSRAQLIQEMHKWLPHSEKHIAAKQLLDEMDRIDSDQKHEENIKTTKEANRLSRVAIFIAILSLIVATIALCDKKQTTTQETPSIESRKPVSPSVPASNSKSAIQQEKVLKDKQKK